MPSCGGTHVPGPAATFCRDGSPRERNRPVRRTRDAYSRADGRRQRYLDDRLLSCHRGHGDGPPRQLPVVELEPAEGPSTSIATIRSAMASRRFHRQDRIVRLMRSSPSSRPISAPLPPRRSHTGWASRKGSMHHARGAGGGAAAGIAARRILRSSDPVHGRRARPGRAKRPYLAGWAILGQNLAGPLSPPLLGSASVPSQRNVDGLRGPGSGPRA